MARSKSASAVGWVLCAALWAAVLAYAWNQRIFLAQAARLFQ